MEFQDPKSRIIFLINNYDLITSLLSEYKATCFDEEKEHFTEILNKSVGIFVEEELVPIFGLLMNFVMRVEADNNCMNVDPGKNHRICSYIVYRSI